MSSPFLSVNYDLAEERNERVNVVTFGHIRSETKWLDGNDSVTNVFD